MTTLMLTLTKMYNLKYLQNNDIILLTYFVTLLLNTATPSNPRMLSLSHVRCPSQGRTSLFHNSVSELVGWLEEVDTDPFLVVIIQTFFLGRGELTTISLPYDAPRAYELVSQQVCLFGLDNLVEGRIPSVLVVFQREYSLSSAAIQWNGQRNAGIWLGSASLEPHTSAMAV